MRPRSLSQIIFEKKEDVFSIQHKVRALHDLNTLVQEILPEEARHLVKVAGYEKGILSLHALNGSVASQLNYQQMHLLSALRKKGFHQLSNIRIKVKPDDAPRKIKRKKPMPISQSASAHIHATAETITDDALKAALQRLAERKK